MNKRSPQNENQELPERDPELRRDNQAQLDELGTDASEVGPGSAGQSGDSEGLSNIPDATGESVEDLAETDQALESQAVAGSEYAADHPEKPVPTHEKDPRAA
ncbi:MAG TPA: hypothetical protein VI386_16830 [Candidatus Sulfotelmatobacter sp.]